MTQVVQTLDDIGSPAWIATMVLGFILFWPLGLAVLAFILWSGRMPCGWKGGRGRWESRFSDGFNRARSRVEQGVRGCSSGSGNRAFDDYREATLRRLEEEEREFRSFLDRLRQAKDKAEFDQFMADRRDTPQPGPST